MRVGIVGAGMAGLAAARTLKSAGFEVVLFEKSGSVGGRVATQKLGPYTFDTGATSIAPRGLSIEHVMLNELPQDDLVQVTKPIFTHTFLRISSGDAARAKVPRYAYKSGNNTFAQLLAAGQDVRLDTQVEEITRAGGRFVILGEEFDALVLTPPIPQTSTLLWSLDETRPLANSSYRSCLAVALGFAKSLAPQHYHALLDVDQQHPLTWLSLENEKTPDRAPDGHTAFIAQLNGSYSHAHYGDDDAEIVDLVVDYLARLYGPGWDAPAVSAVKRWKYSQPEGIASFDSVNRPGSKVLIASDGLLGGRIEQAFEAGVRVARLLLKP